MALFNLSPIEGLARSDDTHNLHHISKSIAIDIPKSIPKRRRSKKTSEVFSQQRGCDACPLQNQWPHIFHPKMVLSGAESGDVLVLGEAPGKVEDEQGKAFVGDSGAFLREHLPVRMMDRIAFSNIVRCRPPENRTPTPSEVHACSIFLEDEIRTHNFKFIIGAGGIPLSQFFTENSITQIHGIPFPVEIAGKALWYYPILHPSFVLRTGGKRSSYYPVFAADLRRFFSTEINRPPAKLEKPVERDIVIALTLEEARILRSKLKAPIGVDIETSALRPYELGAKILTAAFSDGNLTFAFSVEHPEQINDWAIDFLLETIQTIPWIAHSLTMELSWFLFFGRKKLSNWEPACYADSMAVVRVYHAREGFLSLGTITKLHLGTNIKTLSSVDPKQIMASPLREILPYNGFDAWGCKKVFDLLRKKVDDAQYDHLIETIRSTTEMELLGLCVDEHASDELFEEWSIKREKTIQASRSIYEVIAYERDFQKELNLGSPKDVGTALTVYGKIPLPTTEKGHISTDDAILQKYLDTNPLIRCVLDYREAQKHLSTYIEPYRTAKDQYGEWVIHPTYTVLHTATFRLSSTSPNIQNVPKRRHREFRKQIIPSANHVFMACDYGQLEARVFAMGSCDRVLCESLIAKEDIHFYWLDRLLTIYPDYLHRLAEKTNQTDEKKIRKAGRDIIKSDIVFASFFGITAKNCAERSGIPLPLVENLLDEFWSRYKDARRWMRSKQKEYENSGEIRTLPGRIRYGIIQGAEFINSPVQSSAAEIVTASQNELSRLSRSENDPHLHPRINIHDDLTFEIPNDVDSIEYYAKRIGEIMTKVRFPSWQIVPLIVEVKIGDNWADMEEIAVIEGSYTH